MNWSGLESFWHMGGYGLYVWGSFGVTFAALLAEVLWLARERSQTLAQLRSAQLADALEPLKGSP